MHTVDEKLQIVINDIKSTNKYNKFVKRAIDEKIKFYTDNKEKLIDFSIEKLKSHSFVSEVLALAENKEKMSFADKLLKKVIGLETHKYAPELNKIQFKNHIIKTPNAFTISEAIAQVLKNNSLAGVQKLVLEL